MKRNTSTLMSFAARFLMAATITNLCICVSLSADPTPQETALFNTVRARMMGHAAQMPHGVADANASFNPGCWSQVFNCPKPPSVVSQVTFVVCTELAAWENGAGESDIGAQYIWTLPDVVIANDKKTITWHNKIMIDAALFADLEAGGIPGQILNEGLLYHEFLHGQLGIEWLITAPSVDGACMCGIPNAVLFSDRNHTQIPGWQDGFITSVAQLFNATVQIMRHDIPASGDGSFSVILGKKNGWTGGSHVPADGNVNSAELSDPNNDGTILLTGKLTDPKKPGKVIVLVDPAQLYIYGFFQVTPAPAPSIPVMSVWGIIVLTLLLLSIAFFFIRHGRSS